MMRRRIAAFCAGLAAVALLGDAAGAASCSALKAELVRMQDVTSPALSRKAGRYDRAWREQAGILARTERQARRAGCSWRSYSDGGLLFFQARPGHACNVLMPKIHKMRANLAKLERMRARYAEAAGARVGSRRIRHIEALIAARGCDRPFHEARAEPQEASTGYVVVLGQGGVGGGSTELATLGGTYRTLCVRTCDGYYFPISFSTTQDRFGDDLATCQARCPGTEVELFYHSGPDADADSGDMTSLGGQSYADLPNAFRYRQQLDKSCTCGRPSQSFAVIGTSTVADEPPPEPAPVRLPLARPAPDEDPETLANREGDFAPRGVAGAVVAQDPRKKPVRIVGPVYWGGPRTEALLRSPVPN